MRYKNLKTGAIIDSSFELEGKDWILFDKESDWEVEEPDFIEESKIDDEDSDQQEDVIDLRKLNRAELIEFAKTEEITIDEKSKKDEILETIINFYETEEQE